MNQDLVTYYRNRAQEYEKVYGKPERKPELLKATQILQELFRNCEVLEIACGTGFWTRRIAQTARFVRGIDINDTVIETARTRNVLTAKVEYEVADLYRLRHNYAAESLFGGFIWSHILLQNLPAFTDQINSLVKPGGMVVLMDNNYVNGSSTPITEADKFGNTYQYRKLEDGSLHQILKNFPTEEEIRNILQGKAMDIHFINLRYYWILIYRTVSPEV